MARRIVLIAVTALVVAACGSADTADTTTSVLPAVTTTESETTTTAAAPATTTTTIADAPTADGSSSPQLAAIRAAISQSAEVTSGRMEGVIEVSGSVDGGGALDLSMPFGGSFDTASGNSSFYMDMSAMGAAGGEEFPPEFADMFGEMEVRTIDGISYIKFPFFTMMFGAETPWISGPAEEGSDLTSSFTFARPNDPTEFLEALEDADAEVTEIGPETVNGVETTHYRVVFDTAAMLAGLSAEERANLTADGPIPEGEFPMDLWISGDGLVVRYVMEIDGAALADTEDQFDRMVMTFDLLDLNEPVTIVPPDPSEVTEMDSLAGGFFGIPEG